MFHSPLRNFPQGRAIPPFAGQSFGDGTVNGFSQLAKILPERRSPEEPLRVRFVYMGRLRILPVIIYLLLIVKVQSSDIERVFNGSSGAVLMKTSDIMEKAKDVCPKYMLCLLSDVDLASELLTRSPSLATSAVHQTVPHLQLYDDFCFCFAALRIHISVSSYVYLHYVVHCVYVLEFEFNNEEEDS